MMLISNVLIRSTTDKQPQHTHNKRVNLMMVVNLVRVGQKNSLCLLRGKFCPILFRGAGCIGSFENIQPVEGCDIYIYILSLGSHIALHASGVLNGHKLNINFCIISITLDV